MVFNLRDNITFSDGTPLTAEDVLFSFETFRTKGLSDFRTVFNEYVKDAEVLGPHKIKFTFNEGVPTRDLPADVGGLPIFSKAHYEANGLNLEDSFMTPYLGSGAYVPDRIDVGKTITFRRNPDYWAKDLPMAKGQDNFDTIRYEYFSDPSAAFEAFKAGVYTFRIESSSKQWAEQYGFPAVADGSVVKVELPSGPRRTARPSSSTCAVKPGRTRRCARRSA